jgi:hypothetical protein
MKKRMILAMALLLGFFANAADNFRCVTLTATAGGPATFQVQPGETAELVSSVSSIKNSTVQMTYLKGTGGGGLWDFGIPVSGPATITATSTGQNVATITVKLTPDSPDANRTLTLHPGTNLVYVTLEASTNHDYVTLEPNTNQVYVALEVSSNFVDWIEATNGVYSSLNTVRFFRIKTRPLASP